MRDLQTVLPDLLQIDAPVFPVTAADLMAQGYKAGPELGAALNALRDYWLEKNCAATKVSVWRCLNLEFEFWEIGN